MTNLNTLSEKTGLPVSDIEALYSVLNRIDSIEQAILYGSRAKGNYRPGSDIDLVIKGDLDNNSFYEIMRGFDDLMLPYKIDLSIYPQLTDKELREHIDRVGIVFYETKHIQV